jgi:putative membrane protein
LTGALAAYLHYVAMVSIAVCLAYEYKVCAPGLSPEQARWLARVDLCYFAAAMLALGTGIARLIWFGKGLDFYTGNPVFYIKLALFLALGLISLPPTLQFLRWRRALRDRAPMELSDYRVLRVRRFVAAELILLACIPLAAAIMARGIGIPASSP